MKLSKSSWHARLYKFFIGWRNPPKSICPYFWSIVGLLIICIPIIIFSTLGYLFDKYLLKEDSYEYNGWLSGDAIVMAFVANFLGTILFTAIRPIFMGLHITSLWSAFAVAIYIVIIVLISAYFIVEYRENRPMKPAKLPKEPSLFKIWFKAKKEKVCPRIDWED